MGEGEEEAGDGQGEGSLNLESSIREHLVSCGWIATDRIIRHERKRKRNWLPSQELFRWASADPSMGLERVWITMEQAIPIQIEMEQAQEGGLDLQEINDLYGNRVSSLLNEERQTRVRPEQVVVSTDRTNLGQDVREIRFEPKQHIAFDPASAPSLHVMQEKYDRMVKEVGERNLNMMIVDEFQRYNPPKKIPPPRPKPKAPKEIKPKKGLNR